MKNKIDIDFDNRDPENINVYVKVSKHEVLKTHCN
jgi:hypothetical protein